MSSMLSRFGPGSGSANHPTPFSGPQSFAFPETFTPQPGSPASSTFGDQSGFGGSTDHLLGNEQRTQGQEAFDQDMANMAHRSGGMGMPNTGELQSRSQSPTTDEPASPSHQIARVVHHHGHGHTPFNSRDFTMMPDHGSSASPAPTLAGTRRTRGFEDGSSLSQLRSGSTTHQLRAFSNRVAVNLKLSRSQSDDLVKMAEVCLTFIFLSCMLILHAQMPLMEMILYNQAHMFKLENQMNKCVGKLYQRHPDFLVRISFLLSHVNTLAEVFPVSRNACGIMLPLLSWHQMLLHMSRVSIRR